MNGAPTQTDYELVTGEAVALVLKASYRRWPQRNLAGNAIDFHTQVLGLSFQQAMRAITAISAQ